MFQIKSSSPPKFLVILYIFYIFFGHIYSIFGDGGDLYNANS